MVRNALGPLLAVGLLAGCHASRIEDTPVSNLTAPTLEGEWLLLDIRPTPAFRQDPTIATYQHLAWISAVRPLWRGTVQRPRWVFQKDHSIVVRWTPAGKLKGRRHPGGTWRRNWRTRAVTVRSRSSDIDHPVSFAGDTLLLEDPTTHLVTRFLPIY
ncbi:MAG: hypothetical protein H7330_09250 [Hymenobacteraceae bacterium]|nr:hypothetical protein [Hymenobacteraceae bacterium]